MKKNKPYEDDKLESVFRYSKKLIGMTFKNILEEYYTENKLDSKLLEEEISKYNNAKAKGGLGNLLEKYYYFYEPNNISEPDFPKIGTELKVTPYEKKSSSSNNLKAGERLVITMIPNNEEISPNFENSHLKKKISKILMIWYERKKEQLKILNKIGFVNLFDIYDKLHEKDFEIICEDYEKIATKIREGKAHELSEGDTRYLGACTKGATAENSLQPQYYNKEIYAKRRAFSLKQSYMTYLLNSYVKTGLMEYDSIFSNEDLKNNKFDDYIINKISQHIGETEKELYEKFKINDDANHRNRILVNKILGVNTENSEEFEKANIVIKTIRVKNNGTPKESMSFPKICIRDFVNQEFEDSYEYSYFAETRFLFVVFKESEKDVYKLKGVKFWNMPIEELETIGKLEWEAYKNKFIEGINFEILSNGKRIKNDLPKKSNHKIFHLRPHSKKSAYLINGKKYGNGTDSDMDSLLDVNDGDKMVYQCFWLNNTYIKEIIKDIL